MCLKNLIVGNSKRVRKKVVKGARILVIEAYLGDYKSGMLENLCINVSGLSGIACLIDFLMFFLLISYCVYAFVHN